jgi:hypothetical protein
VQGLLPRSSDIDDFYHCAPMASGEHAPHTATALVNLATVTRSNHVTVIALTKALVELTDFTQIKSAELRRLAGVDALAGIAPTTHVVPKSATSVRGNGRARTFECQKYKTKTKNNNECWSHGYQVGADQTSLTCIKRKEGHNHAATKDNIMGGDTWGMELL